MKLLPIFITLFLLIEIAVFAQVGINTDNSLPDNSAILDIKSINSGLLIPRLTSAQIAFMSFNAAPAAGLEVFCTTDNKWYIYDGSLWKEVSFGTGTITPFVCGNLYPKSHAAGTVAPVTKTVNYGTVGNIPGIPSKCWITSNLGADHQATSVTDATEASAGWYWQFNLKQGYKHDGTNRTPNSAWISSISENSDWLQANDPCTLLLGSSWRIPSLTEWNNADAAGNWTSYVSTWNSALKIHAAGTLTDNGGSLINRGAYGNYWSSSQGSAANGWFFFISSNASATAGNSKAYGFSIRCLKD